MRFYLVLSIFLFLGTGCPQPLPDLDDLFLRPSSRSYGTPKTHGFDFEEVILPITDERHISIWHVFAEDPKAIIVIVPGSDANKSRYTEILPILVPNGYDVILIDYEGYGDSPGYADLNFLMDDAKAVFEYAVDRHEKVIGFGVSIGTPILARMAAEFELAACIFEGTLILKDEPRLWLERWSLDIEQVYIPANLWVSFQVPFSYDIDFWITLVSESKFFIHSIEDNITPYQGGWRIFEAASEPKDFWTVWGEHGRIVRLETDLYENTIISWIEKNVR